MSLPPQQIRVKRKRAEDDPVTYLQFDSSSKRRRGDSNASTALVYKRKDSENSPTDADSELSPLPLRPIIRSSKPGDEIRGTRPSERHALANAASPPAASGDKPSLVSERRRYHISRTALSSGFKTGRRSSPLAGSICKRGHHGPIFIERRRLPPGHAAESSVWDSRTEETIQTSHGQDTTKAVDADMAGSRDTTPPSHSRSRQTPGTLSSPSGNHHPLPFVDSSTQNLDKIAASMNTWVLEEMWYSLKDDNTGKSLRKPSSRFYPKAPAQRYAERHPEIAKTGSTLDARGTSTYKPTGNKADVTDDDYDIDSECIYDTYERVPAGRLESTHDLGDVGVLVLENEDEAEYFYWQDEDSDQDETDEEDENAETHYTADYPEDEVDSDDEYDVRAYKYRNGNASDEEEYFGDRGPGLDEDDDELTHEGELDQEMVVAKIKRFNQNIRERSNRG